MVVAVGGAATGVFCSSDIPWATVESAGYYTGDRMWRFPLWNYYSLLLKGNLMYMVNILFTYVISQNNMIIHRTYASDIPYYQ